MSSTGGRLPEVLMKHPKAATVAPMFTPLRRDDPMPVNGRMRALNGRYEGASRNSEPDIKLVGLKRVGTIHLPARMRLRGFGTPTASHAPGASINTNGLHD